MKTRFWFICFSLLLHFGIHGQTVLSGVVTDSLNVPIPNAAVYLSKTTIGILANRDGVYSLSIPQAGTYELIASCVGYKSHSQIISARDNTQKINIKLNKRIVLIKEITVKGKDKNRWQNYDQFLKCFIGGTANAPFCTIENPKDLIVFRESNGCNLIAYSIKPLIITNSSLGYKIIYDLKHFKYDLNTQDFSFSGNYYFQDISNQKRENSRTKRNRLIAYYGSRMHFLRALFTGSLSQEKFEMCNIGLDSCGRKIVTNSIQENELRLFINPDSMTIFHPNPIMIYYSDNHPELFQLPQVYHSGTYTSRITFSDTLQVYKNGNYPDGYNFFWSGNMARDRIAEMLPYDFVPKPIAKREELFPK